MNTTRPLEQRHSILVTLLLLGALSAMMPGDARACSYYIGPGWIEEFGVNALEVPSGGYVIVADEEDLSIQNDAGEEVGTLTKDEDLTALATSSAEHQQSLLVYRIPELAEGTYKSKSREFTVVPTPASAPGAATLQGLRVTYVTEAQGDRTGAECPELDTMKFALEGATSPSYITAYIGDTQGDVDALEAPNYWMPISRSNMGSKQVDFVLGPATIHSRSGIGLNREKLCFSLAWMDGMGRIGERSEVECLSTIDPSDPLVEAQRSSRAAFGGCASTGTSGAPMSAWPIALLGVLWGWRRRRDPR